MDTTDEPMPLATAEDLLDILDVLARRYPEAPSRLSELQEARQLILERADFCAVAISAAQVDDLLRRLPDEIADRQCAAADANLRSLHVEAARLTGGPI